MVDGTPMVRDVWVDFNGDHQKQADEFRTVAVTGEREGGRSYFALDVTDPRGPRFLWNWPPAGHQRRPGGGRVLERPRSRRSAHRAHRRGGRAAARSR